MTKTAVILAAGLGSRTARNLLLAERPWRAELGGVHGGERGVTCPTGICFLVPVISLKDNIENAKLIFYC